MKVTRNTQIFGVVSLLAIAGAAFIFSSSVEGEASTSRKSPKALPLVSLIEAQPRDLPVVFSTQGHLVPLNQVDVRPQVNGTIRTVDFKEGDDIKAGQLLFTLDATDKQALLKRAEAQASSIAAQLEEARRDLERSKELAAKGFFSASAVDTAVSKVDTLSAQLKAAQADVSGARVQVDFTRIIAPISAKAGAVNVYPGSLALQGDSAALVSLLQFDPIGAQFTLPEQHLGALLAARARGEVTVSVTTLDGATIEGDIVFLNNAVNTNTGTIVLKARFPNAELQLWPGSFVRLKITAGFDKSAIVLPPQAVLEGPDGHFVFQIDSDGAAVSREVKLLRIQDQYAVVSGLSLGERVVVEGNQNLRAGMKAKIVEATEEGATQ